MEEAESEVDGAFGLVVVTPVFEDASAAARLFKDLATALGRDVRVVAVDDGSASGALGPAALASAGLRGTIIRLRRNVGHQRAIAVGVCHLAEAVPDATCVVMDCDGEDAPALVPGLLARLAAGGTDIVVARRRNRSESIGFRGFYLIYKALFRLLTGRAISFGNFMALSPRALERLASMPELWIHAAGSVLLSRLPIAFVPVDRAQRYSGVSRMNFAGLVLHGLRALMVFAEDVLVRVGLVCAFVAALSIAAIFATVVLKIIGLATPGWFSVALGILVLVLLQTGTLTLTTLMLSGVIGAGDLTRIDHRALIREIIEVTPP